MSNSDSRSLFRRSVVKGAATLWRIQLLSRGHLIPFLQPYWKTEEIQTGREWLTGRLAQGSAFEVEEFETGFLRATGLDGLGVATSSGRTALSVGLRALKNEQPDRNQVVIPSYSCHGLVEPILKNGLTPVYADVGHDLNLSEATVLPHISSKTLAVVLVHLGGKYAAEREAIALRVEQKGAVLIEDLCHSLGGRREEIHRGASAPMAIYSFGLGKNLTATAGGMLIARTAYQNVPAEKARLASEQPSCACDRFSYMAEAYMRSGLAMVTRRPAMPVEAFRSSYGYNRMSLLDVQLMNSQLRRVDEIVGARRKNAYVLLSAIEDSSRLIVPGKEDRANVWTKFIAVADSIANARRIRKTLRRAGIETETMYTPLHLIEGAATSARCSLPVTEGVYKRVFNLPVRPSIAPQQIEYVARTLRHAVSF